MLTHMLIAFLLGPVFALVICAFTSAINRAYAIIAEHDDPNPVETIALVMFVATLLLTITVHT